MSVFSFQAELPNHTVFQLQGNLPEDKTPAERKDILDAGLAAIDYTRAITELPILREQLRLSHQRLTDAQKSLAEMEAPGHKPSKAEEAAIGNLKLSTERMLSDIVLGEKAIGEAENRVNTAQGL